MIILNDLSVIIILEVAWFQLANLGPTFSHILCSFWDRFSNLYIF